MLIERGKFFISKARKNISEGFIHDVSILASGTTIAQIIPFLVYPLIGRLYTPEQAAILAVFSSVVSIILVFSTGKYEYAVFLAKTDLEAANIVTLAFSICCFTCLLASFIFLIAPGFVTYCVGYDIHSILFLIPIGIISTCIYEAYNEWCVRKKYFKKLSLNKMTNSVSVNLGKVGLAYTVFAGNGLVLGDVLGRCITAMACTYRVIKTDFQVFQNVSIKEMLGVAKDYSQFPKFTMPSQLLNTLGDSLPVIILASKFDEKQVGLYSMAVAIMYVPISVIGKSFKDVFRKKIRDLYHISPTIRLSFLRLLKIVSIISISFAICFVYFLPWIFSLFLGEQWEASGIYAQILTPMLVVNFVATCVDGVLIVAGKLKQIFYWQIFYFLSSVLPVIIGVLFIDSFILIVYLVSFSKLLCQLALVLLSYHYTKEMDIVS